ncbi:hypothetical protein VVD49_01625 [Uliginosibacterium sp. H3]|uniref:O-antigen ligase n=1 Tax=Uliginosibacterium silvisoli TaxID=3114758 RepID=A0ABU6JYI5_9RHOO|nr:hypothetical protein [Uliginosibacterium sp. H3]
MLGDVLIRNTVFWVSIALSMLCVAFPPFRYLFFAVPLLVLIATLGDREARLGDEAKPFLAFVLAGLVLSPLANTEGMKDLFLTFSGISIALLCQVPVVRARTLFVCSLIAALIYFPLFGNFRGSLQFDIIKSISPFESNFGFVFGMVAVFALMEGRKWLAFLCLVLAVVCLKRIAVLGAMVCFVMWWVGEKNGRRILNPAFMVIANLGLLAFVLLYGAGYLDSAILALTGESANQIGVGRRGLLSLPANEFFHHPEQFIAFGQGPGSTYGLATMGANEYGGKANLHSDLLKIFYEYGVLFYAIFIWLMYSSRRYSTRIAFLFMNVLFLTDNTLIYYFLLLVFAVGVRSLEDAGKEFAMESPQSLADDHSVALASLTR